MTFNLTSNGTILSVGAVRFCFRRSFAIDKFLGYTIYDVAVLRRGALIPLDALAAYADDTGELCASITPEQGATYIPIIRSDNWQDQRRELFTTAELVFLIIDVVAYIVLMLLLLLLIIPLVRTRRFPFGAGVIIPLSSPFPLSSFSPTTDLTLALLYATRVLYFSLTLAGQLTGDDAGLGSYVLIEIPLLLNLYSAIFFMINFVYISRMVNRLIVNTKQDVRFWFTSSSLLNLSQGMACYPHRLLHRGRSHPRHIRCFLGRLWHRRSASKDDLQEPPGGPIGSPDCDPLHFSCVSHQHRDHLFPRRRRLPGLWCLHEVEDGSRRSVIWNRRRCHERGQGPKGREEAASTGSHVAAHWSIVPLPRHHGLLHARHRGHS